MARQESDREDLLREATALAERIELAPPTGHADEPIVIGFRDSGATSVFFGAEPAYHFNSAGELRRAYVDAKLYKAERGRLVELDRVRVANAVELRRRELSAAEQGDFVTAMREQLRTLHANLHDHKIVGQVPADADILGRVSDWLQSLGDVKVAEKPHAL